MSDPVETLARALYAAYSLGVVDERTKSQEERFYESSARALVPQIVAEAVAAERERCAKVAEDHSFAMDIEWWLKSTKKEVSAHACLSVAAAIRVPGGGGRDMKYLALVGALLAAPALAGGPSTIPGDQCDVPFEALAYPEAPDDVVAAWNEVGLRAWQDACTTPGERLRARGWTDEDLTAWALGGDDVTPAPVPLTGSIYMMIIALAVLLGWRKA